MYFIQTFCYLASQVTPAPATPAAATEQGGKGDASAAHQATTPTTNGGSAPAENGQTSEARTASTSDVASLMDATPSLSTSQPEEKKAEPEQVKVLEAGWFGLISASVVLL